MTSPIEPEASYRRGYAQAFSMLLHWLDAGYTPDQFRQHYEEIVKWRHHAPQGERVNPPLIGVPPAGPPPKSA